MSLLQRLFGARKSGRRKETSPEAVGPAQFLPKDFNMQLFADLSGNEAANKVADGEVERHTANRTLSAPLVAGGRSERPCEQDRRGGPIAECGCQASRGADIRSA